MLAGLSLAAPTHEQHEALGVISPQPPSSSFCSRSRVHANASDAGRRRDLAGAFAFGACRSACVDNPRCFAFRHEGESCGLDVAEYHPAWEAYDGPTAFSCKAPGDGVFIPGSSGLVSTGDLRLPTAEGSKAQELGLTSSKIFCLGPGKTGTMTLYEIFGQLDMTKCHDRCDNEDKSWSEFDRDYAGLWKKYQAYMDNGHLADPEWLEEHFQNSRFVYNTRPLYDWVLSRFDHIKETRERGGCSSVGDKDNCKEGIFEDGAKTDAVMNTLIDMAYIIRDVARAQRSHRSWFQMESTLFDACIPSGSLGHLKVWGPPVPPQGTRDALGAVK